MNMKTVVFVILALQHSKNSVGRKNQQRFPQVMIEHFFKKKQTKAMDNENNTTF